MVRLSAVARESVEANGGNPATEGLPNRRAVKIARALRGQLRETVGSVPVPYAAQLPIRPSGTDLPAEPSFRSTSPRVFGPQRLQACFAMSSGLLVAAAAIASAQKNSANPFNWVDFAVALGLVLLGAAALLLGIAFVQDAELAIGRGWIARRRHFRRNWSVLGFSDLVSVMARRGANGSPALVLQSGSRLQVVVRALVLGTGAARALGTEIGDSPALLPSASQLLSGALPRFPGKPFLAEPRRPLRLNRATMWGNLLVAFALTAAAVAVAAVHHAFWVVIPSVVAVGSLLWGALRPHRQTTRTASAPAPGAFESVGVGQSSVGRTRNPSVTALGFGQLAAWVTVVCAAAAVGSGSSLASLAISGAPGYSTYTGPRGLPLEVGEPWGTACEPIVFVAKDLPSDVYLEARDVVVAARAAGLDMAIDDDHGHWSPTDLYPPGLTEAQVTFVPVFVDSTSTPRRSNGEPEHLSFGWDTRLSPDRRHEILTDMQATLYLKNLGSDPISIGRSIRQLVAFSEGVSDTTIAGSAIADNSTARGFLQTDLSALHLMSGCPAV